MILIKDVWCGDIASMHPHVAYRDERRAACKKFYETMKLWKGNLPRDVWTKIRDEAIELFMDEWDAKGRAIGLLLLVTCVFPLSILF